MIQVSFIRVKHGFEVPFVKDYTGIEFTKMETIETVPLGAERTAAHSTGKATENGAGYRAEGYTDWSGDYAEGCAGLAACQGCANATCKAADSADGRASFHGVMERSDFGGVAARALQ